MNAILKQNATADYVVTDLGVFQVLGGKFRLKEYFAPYTPEWIVEKTDADIVVEADCSACLDL